MHVSMMKCLALAGLGGITMLSLGCSSNANTLAEMSAKRGDVRYSATTGKMFRSYDYYPSVQVFYSPFQDTYFWNDGMNWHRTTTLPSHFDGMLDDPVLIELPTSAPHLMHKQVANRYPSTTSLRHTLAALDAEYAPNGSDEFNESWSNDNWTAIANVPTEY